MTRGRGANLVIKIARPARIALTNVRCASDRYPSGRPGAFVGEFHPERAGAAASAW